ncbi:uncharacterized protein LOC124462873 [Hypomesus transpacificus]|uniref:uncharacterized protein LOC124462873 n=1 Tax=Hypomesus transpacificus TaxID=137520 RepID=UPI001F071BEE|nr:uncharacterized protein LOC124462873 [Hypomesus transpacificus]
MPGAQQDTAVPISVIGLVGRDGIVCSWMGTAPRYQRRVWRQTGVEPGILCGSVPLTPCWETGWWKYYYYWSGWMDTCCYYRQNIHVKSCPGNYYVYKLVQLDNCYSAYCAAVPTTTPAVPTTTPAVPTTNSSSVRFWCGATPCPAGQDCLSVNGALRCADPCEQYSVLDDAWRSTGYGRAENYDYHRFSGHRWYRMFLDGNSTQMPETCVEVNRCGTRVPLWLSSPHPLLGDGVVEGDVCGHYIKYYDWSTHGNRREDDCCNYRQNIHVKSCPGNYYVYKLVPSDYYYSAFCAAVPKTTPAVPMTPSSSVRFWCGATPCPAGQDCLSVNGALRCADPCEQYSVLDDAWRSTDNGFSSNCDAWRGWQGWYRMFLGGTSVQMPETCMDRNRCGTRYPLWLSSPHPLLGDNVVERDVCGRWSSDCCYYGKKIHVKACPGNYYVYKLVQLEFCYSAYCADPKTKVCATCEEYEDCVSHNNVTWACEIRVIPELVCGRSFLDVGLLKSQLAAKHLHSSSVHLVNARCSSSQEINGTVWFQMERWEGSCGTTLTTNGSHHIYSNSLFVYPVSETLVRPLRIPFSCSYPLETVASLDVAIKPYLE